MLTNIADTIVTAIVSAVVSVLVAGVSVWATQKVILERVSNVNDKMTRIEQRLDKVFDDIYEPRQSYEKNN